MTGPFWAYFWPVLAFGVASGLVSGIIGFHRPRGAWLLVVAGVVAIGMTALWHGPLGAADRFSAAVEHDARDTLDFYEMYKVQAHLHRAPLTRRLVLSGPADDFQSSELVRIMGSLPGVSRATWSPNSAGMPLLLEAELLSILGFLGGLVLAYVIELRRRYNAQWRW